MTDDTFDRLEALVEQTLRHVWASRTRKQLLRMELLSHVIDVFEEEFAISGVERTALNRTLCRFGLAQAVGSELQSSLGFADRWFHLFTKETLMSRWLWLLAIVAIFVGPAFIMPAVAQFNQAGVLTVFPLMLGVAITLMGLALAGYGIKRRLAHN